MKRKKKMPAGLRRYWAKKRKAKNARRKTKNVRRTRNTRTRVRRPYNRLIPKAKRNRPIKPRKAKRTTKRPRKGLTRNNPVNLGITLTPTQRRKLGQQISRLTGKRVRWV